MELTEAKQLAMELALPLGVEWVRLEEALGRVLAETLVAARDVPMECRSRLDGFALRSVDTDDAAAQSPVTLKLRPELFAAGHPAAQGIEPGESVRILTGAPVPQGADAVAPQEGVLRTGDTLVLKRRFFRGSGVTHPGDEIREGEKLLPKGKILTPTRLAIIASLGYPKIPVFIRPRVALLATGDELRELGESRQGPYTFCNNRYLLSWLVSLQGGDPVHLGVVGDDPRAVASALRDARADLVVTTGGMGRGDRDFVLDAWQMLGIAPHFRELNLSPGKNSAFGSLEGRFYWGVPGNPWGAQVIFEELIAPTLKRLQGADDAEEPRIAARLETSIEKKEGNHKAVRGVLNVGNVSPSFTPTRNKGASLLAELRDSFAYILVESHVVRVAAGSEVQVRLNDLPLLAVPLFGTVGLCRS